MAKQRFHCRSFGRFLVVSATVLFFSNCLWGAQQDSSESLRYRIFPLKYISVEQGKEYLSQAGFGTVSHIPGSAALLVTAQEDDFLKAMTILNLVDCRGQFAVSTALGTSVAENLPSNKLIASKVGNISIGSLSNPPAVHAKARAIIDTNNGAVLVIAPAGLLDRVLNAVRQLSISDKTNTRINSGTSGKWKSPELVSPEVPGLHLASKGKITTHPNPVPTILEQEMPKLPSQGLPKRAAALKPYGPQQVANGDDVLQLALPETLDITEFLGFVGEHLNLNYLYDPLKVKGNITLKRHGKLRGPIKLKELYPLLESVLQFHGFVMTRRGNLVRIVPVSEALNIDPTLMEADEGQIEAGDVIVTRVFELEHVSTNSARNLLDSMRLTLDVREITETQTIIVTGYAYRMPRIESLLDMVDRPGEPRRFRFRQLQYTMAETLAPKIQALAEQLGTISITIAAAPAAPQPTTSTRKPGETTAQWQARVRSEAAARLRATTRPTTTAQKAEPAKPTVFLDADERTNRILMIGLDEQLDEVEELIDTLDVAQHDLKILKLYEIDYVDAEEARRKLEELCIIAPIHTSTYPYSSTSRITGTTARPTTIQSPTTTSRYPTTKTTGILPERIKGEPQVVVVEPTNSLLVNATAEQHTQIAEIIRYVDCEMQEGEVPCQVYPLENQSPDHLFSILDPLVQETVLDKEGKIESVIRKQDEQIIIVPDPNTFSLIVYASKKNQEWIATLIEKLDKRRPQVLIDVTLVEISKADAFDYDLNIIQSFPDLVATSGLTGAVMPGVGEGAGLVSKLLESGRDRFIDFQSNSGAGTGFYGDRHINALLTAMQTKDYGRVLAKPKILVNDNEPGTIHTGDTTYVAKQTGTIIQGATAGTVQTSLDYDPYPAGITLTIIPHISRGNLLRLDIALDRSDFGTITGEKPPDTTESNIETTVTVPDRSTIILGGMLKLNQSKGGTKVPILGDIPFLGGLFRSTSNSDLQRNLYVFVKAEIIRPDDEGFAQSDLQRISDRNREAFEKHEIEFQDYRNWPGIKPRKMTPFKVLDAE